MHQDLTAQKNKTFDVFLCHNDKDKPEVKKIGEELKRRGIKPWLDEWEIRPGTSWPDVLQKQINQINAVAVFVGKEGVGPWQNLELNAYIRKFINIGCPVIPVLLGDASEEPTLPVFLEGMQYVDFRKPVTNPMEQLIWGITGTNPNQTGPVPGTHPSRVQLADAPRIYRGHTYPVCKLAWSPDSMYLASVSREKTVRIWNDVTSMPYQAYSGQGEVVNSVAWSPNGTCVVSGDSNGIINVWDTTTGEMRLSLRSYLRDAVYDVAWSPASRIAVARASNIVQIYEIYNNQLRDCPPNYVDHSPGIGSLNGVLKVAWSTDGTLVASSGWDKTVQVWIPMIGTTICTYHGHGEQVIYGLSWSPKGPRLATAGSDGTIQLWNADNGSTLLTCRMLSGQYVASICWSPDGTCLASAGSDGSIHIWDTTNGNTLLMHRIAEGSILRAVAWSPDGQRLAVACPNGDIQVWPMSLNPWIVPDENVQRD